jgi:S1-C subfamily serine protease
MDHAMSGERPLDPPRDSTPNLTWLILILFVLVGVFWYRTRLPNESALHDPAAEPRPVEARGDLADDEKSTIALFKQASPSVVNITTTSRKRDMLRMRTQDVPSGSGSGFLWDRKGYVVTNFHVIQSASSAQVVLADRSMWDARLVGGEPDKDIAVLKIDAPEDRLPPILVGTSNDLQVGQKVFAIGNPFGLDQTLTTGIISALGREIQSVTQRPIQDVIQTNAAINPGNSGGPLLDSAGRLIAMNTAIYSPSGGSVGIGFAVPVDTIARVVPQLIRTGRVEKVGLGINIAPDHVASRFGVTGVLVVETVPGLGAATAGLRPTTVDDSDHVILGDIIVEVNGKRVRNSNDLFRALDSVRAGTKVPVKVLRNEAEVAVEVEAGVLESP